MTKTKAKIGLLLVTASWGVAFPLTPMVMSKGLSANTIVMFKGLLFLICCCIFFRNAITRMKRSDFLYAGLAGIGNMAGNILQTLGMVYTTPSNCAFLTVTNVIMVPFIALLLFREKPGKKSFLCVPLCVLGMAILTGVLQSGIVINIGDVYSFGGAAGFAFTIALLAHGQADFKVIAFGLAITQFGGGLAALLIAGESIAAAQWAFVIPALLYLGIIATFIAASVQCYVQKYISSTTAALIMTMESVFGSIFSLLLGAEPFTCTLALGGLLIVLSVIFMETNLLPFWQEKHPAA
ncbi:MAG: DMT family transporter [Treponema sp.]|jgi:drug/metabolite transporter (DMT)-like permease|nr:DMT family transporter [Treponema sp.]